MNILYLRWLSSLIYLQLPLLDIALLKVLGSLMLCALTAITRFWRFRSPQLDVCLLSDRLTETWLQQITKNRQEKSLKILSISLGKSKSESSLHIDELNMKMCLVFVADLLSTLLILSFPEDIFKMHEKNIGWSRNILQRDTQSMVMSCMDIPMVTNDKFLQKTDYSKIIVLNLLII